jgi:hypothetical protein
MDWESKHFNAALFAALLIIEAELKRLHHMENIACERQGAADDQRKDGRHMTLGGFRRKHWTSVANQGIDRAPSVGGALAEVSRTPGRARLARAVRVITFILLHKQHCSFISRSLRQLHALPIQPKYAASPFFPP